jgi:hypothetical protein
LLACAYAAADPRKVKNKLITANFASAVQFFLGIENPPVDVIELELAPQECRGGRAALRRGERARNALIILLAACGCKLKNGLDPLD